MDGYENMNIRRIWMDMLFVIIRMDGYVKFHIRATPWRILIAHYANKSASVLGLSF